MFLVGLPGTHGTIIEPSSPDVICERNSGVLLASRHPTAKTPKSTMNNQLSTWFNLQALLLDPLGVQVKCFDVLPFQLWTLTG